MTYDLWDVELRKYFGQFDSEIEALSVVRSLIDAYGDDYADDMELAGEDDRPNLTGRALVERTRRLVPAADPVER